MKIMITGGGTGGHTSPAVAVIEELKRRDPQLLLQWVGKKNSMEERVAAQQQVPFRSIPVEGWTRKKSPRVIITGLKLLWSLFRVWFYLKVFRPQVVFGVGGYVSLPAIWVAQRLGIHTVLHEQNKRLGLANRLCAARASRLLLSYPDTVGTFPKENAKVVGNPVRAVFMNPQEQQEARETLGLRSDIPVILVVGGSQGAHTLNESMIKVIHDFGKEEAQFIWGAGKSEAIQMRLKAEGAAALTQIHAFIEDMGTACTAADIIVSRAGASTTAELAVLEKPSILIPYPHAADNHQEHNARAFEAAGAAVVLLDKECNGESLGTLLRELLTDQNRITEMGKAAKKLAKPLATETIAETIMELVHGK
ncbi:MAG: undecaprenyldiphospho-muramoylpentapeptide beta-N-acetylglucosaminyltransferase [Candidatus Hydrogenedentes bacterium]|nr:undecaprenyldiphospho-muramoylpentapeptide beta-N-acetylglucosaminyltransferase [Candidatus Hydrogenedentota bacterium]